MNSNLPYAHPLSTTCLRGTQVAFELLHSAAVTTGAKITQCVHTEGKQKQSSKLIMVSESIDAYVESGQTTSLDVVLRSERDARDVFLRHDSDKSGAIDRTELTHVLKQLKLPHAKPDLDRIYSVYDLDSSGFFELEEFLDLLESYKKELRQIKRQRRYMASEDNKAEFIPPETGQLTIRYFCEKRAHDYEWQKNTVTTDTETARLINMLKHANNFSSVLELSLGHLSLGWVGTVTSFCSGHHAFLSSLLLSLYALVAMNRQSYCTKRL